MVIAEKRIILARLLDSLNTTAQHMRATSDLMVALIKEHPEIHKHGLELAGAAGMVDEWFKGVSREFK